MTQLLELSLGFRDRNAAAREILAIACVETPGAGQTSSFPSETWTAARYGCGAGEVQTQAALPTPSPAPLC